MKLSEAVHEAVALAEKIRAYWDAELPKRHPGYPIIKPGEPTTPPPPEEGELRKLLSGLPEDDVYALALLMYVGRGDYERDDVSASLKEIRKTFDRPETAIAQMMQKAPLADYLRDGLDTLTRRGIDVDNLPTIARAAA